LPQKQQPVHIPSTTVPHTVHTPRGIFRARAGDDVFINWTGGLGAKRLRHGSGRQGGTSCTCSGPNESPHRPGACIFLAAERKETQTAPAAASTSPPQPLCKLKMGFLGPGTCALPPLDARRARTGRSWRHNAALAAGQPASSPGVEREGRHRSRPPVSSPCPYTAGRPNPSRSPHACRAPT
jgi:hypothetical protein